MYIAKNISLCCVHIAFYFKYKNLSCLNGEKGKEEQEQVSNFFFLLARFSRSSK